MPLARVGEIELSYERAGSGPPLLLIMGMSGTFCHWAAAFLDDLRRDFEMIVYDHRGVGASSRLGRDRLTIAQLAAGRRGSARRARDRIGARAGLSQWAEWSRRSCALHIPSASAHSPSAAPIAVARAARYPRGDPA